MRLRFATVAAAAALLAPGGLLAQTDVDKAAQAVSSNVIRAHIEFLAGDALEGRGTGTRGGLLAAQYVAAQFLRLGLQPAGDSGSFFFKVPLIGFTPSPTLRIGGTELAYPTEYVLNPMRWDSVTAVDAPLVFVGFGIVAPEWGWNDYAGLDVKDKIVVAMVNDPGLRDSTIFKGEILTYYGRWTYKLEEAARQGAAGVLLIHTDETATYPWGVLEGSLAGHQVRLETAPTSLRVAGWVRHDVLGQILATAGQDLAQAMTRASQRGFKGFDLPLRAQASVRATMERTQTTNVLGRLPGTTGPLSSEVVVVGAHYDHLGIGLAVDGDSIYNGARDNAAGVGEMLAVAEAMSETGFKGKRSIVFAAFGGEESGLLGSEAMVARPFMPLRDVAAMVNFDDANLFGRTRDVSAMGSDQSSLLGALQAAARLEGLQVTDDSSALIRGSFFRSDNFPFARAGIPSISFEPGNNFVGRPPDYGDKAKAEYNATRYHRPQDEWGSWYNLDGAVQETRVGLRTITYAANASSQPTWNLTSEFHAAGVARTAPPTSN